MPRKQDAFGVHLKLTSDIELAYKERDVDPQALQKTIDLCRTQIAISEEAKDAWLKECDDLGGSNLMPIHRGYETLCIIFEKQKRFNEAVELATQAKKQGWNGDWDKRIERCGEKLKLAKNSI